MKMVVSLQYEKQQNKQNNMEQYKELIGKHITYILAQKKGGYRNGTTIAVDGIIERVEVSESDFFYFIVNGRYALCCTKSELEQALSCNHEYDCDYFYKLFAIYDKPTKEEVTL